MDPLLVAPTDPIGPDGIPFTADDGYILRQGSPCIDAGVTADDAGVTRDILGMSRPQGAGWDIGAYEVQGRAPSGEEIQAGRL